MSEDGGHDELSDLLLWENYYLSNSDCNSAGTTTGTGGSSEDQKKSAYDAPKDQQEEEEEALQVDETKKKNKRGRGKNGKGKIGEAAGKGGSGDQSDHEMHIWTERERRKKMRCMFSNLHSLLPHLSPKADKSTIVDEAVNYIKTLQQTFENLQKKKLERLQTEAGPINFGFAGKSPMIISTTGRQKQSFDPSSSREAFMAANYINSGASKSSNNNNNDNISNSPFPVLFQTWTSSNVVLNICGQEAQISVCSPKKPRLLTNICYVLEKHNIEVISAQVSSDSNRTMFMIQAKASSSGAGASNEQTSEVEEIFKQGASEIMRWVSS